MEVDENTGEEKDRSEEGGDEMTDEQQEGQMEEHAEDDKSEEKEGAEKSEDQESETDERGENEGEEDKEEKNKGQEEGREEDKSIPADQGQKPKVCCSKVNSRKCVEGKDVPNNFNLTFHRRKRMGVRMMMHRWNLQRGRNIHQMDRQERRTFRVTPQ